MRFNRTFCAIGTIAATIAGTTPAFAHSANDAVLGFQTGFMHPLTGLDHLVAMVAVGLWGAQLDRPAIWLLPITFPLVMSLGSVAGIVGVPLPLTEVIIGLSAVALGLAVALRAKPPIWGAAVIVAVFALFHGYAHGKELPDAADPLGYGVGFVTATGLLHLSGIVIGLAIRWPIGERLVRIGGVAIAGIGAFFLWSLTGVAP